MADRYGAVLREEKQCHRLADDVASADDNAVFTVGAYAVFGEQTHDSGGSAGGESVKTESYSADVCRMECVNVLRRRYRFDDLALVDALRERKLNKYAVDSFVSVQALHEAYKFILGSVFREDERL